MPLAYMPRDEIVITNGGKQLFGRRKTAKPKPKTFGKTELRELRQWCIAHDAHAMCRVVDHCLNNGAFWSSTAYWSEARYYYDTLKFKGML